jgi:hypothetical protein
VSQSFARRENKQVNTERNLLCWLLNNSTILGDIGMGAVEVGVNDFAGGSSSLPAGRREAEEKQSGGLGRQEECRGEFMGWFRLQVPSAAARRTNASSVKSQALLPNLRKYYSLTPAE